MKIYVIDQIVLNNIDTIIANVKDKYNKETNVLKKYDIGTYIIRLKRYRTELISCNYKYNNKINK